MINCSFFSYKGGAGRSSLLYNILPFYAQAIGATNNEPIIVVDLDIDSKGLSYILHDKEFEAPFNCIQVLRQDESINFDRDEEDITKHPFFLGLEPVGAKVGLDRSLNRSILFLTAHSTSKDNRYLGNLSNFDSDSASLREMNALCEDMHCKSIIMDCPAGFQVTGMLALSISHKIITTMRITKQFRVGTYDFLAEKSKEFAGKEYVIVPNAVPKPEDTGYDVESIISEIASRTKESIDERCKCNLAMLSNGRLGINEVKMFKFEESNLKYEESENGRTLKPDEMEAVESYKILSEELAK